MISVTGGGHNPHNLTLVTRMARYHGVFYPSTRKAVH